MIRMTFRIYKNGTDGGESLTSEGPNSQAAQAIALKSTREHSDTPQREARPQD